MKEFNENLLKALQLSKELMLLADKGDLERNDDGCGVVYGVVRDCAYKLKNEAERERDSHKQKDKWN